MINPYLVTVLLPDVLIDSDRNPLPYFEDGYPSSSKTKVVVCYDFVLDAESTRDAKNLALQSFKSSISSPRIVVTCKRLTYFQRLSLFRLDDFHSLTMRRLEPSIQLSDSIEYLVKVEVFSKSVDLGVETVFHSYLRTE